MAADMLVKLYDLQPNPDLDRRMEAEGVTIRRALVPELSGICAWIEPRFGLKGAMIAGPKAFETLH